MPDTRVSLDLGLSVRNYPEQPSEAIWAVEKRPDPRWVRGVPGATGIMCYPAYRREAG
jgi:hypothetical protein